MVSEMDSGLVHSFTYLVSKVVRIRTTNNTHYGDHLEQYNNGFFDGVYIDAMYLKAFTSLVLY